MSSQKVENKKARPKTKSRHIAINLTGKTSSRNATFRPASLRPTLSN